MQAEQFKESYALLQRSSCSRSRLISVPINLSIQRIVTAIIIATISNNIAKIPITLFFGFE